MSRAVNFSLSFARKREREQARTDAVDDETSRKREETTRIKHKLRFARRKGGEKRKREKGGRGRTEYEELNALPFHKLL